MEWHYILLVFDAAIIPIGWMVIRAYGDTRARNAKQDVLNDKTIKHLQDSTVVKEDISQVKTDIQWIKKYLKLNGGNNG